MTNIKIGGITWELHQPDDMVSPVQCFCGKDTSYLGYYTALDIVPQLSESCNVWQCTDQHITTRYRKMTITAFESNCNHQLREYRKLENRWKELKKLILTSNSKDALIDGPNSNPYYTSDQRWGFDSALHWMEIKMKELEEK